jgi:hypothetical protein
MKPLLLTLLVLIRGIAYASDDKPEIGRYQLLYAVTEYAPPENTAGPSTITVKTVWKIDTVTGQVWHFVSTLESNKELIEAFLPIDTRAP